MVRKAKFLYQKEPKEEVVRHYWAHTKILDLFSFAGAAA